MFEILTPELMFEGLPGVFCAGEMLDWEAPTGGYLLNACLASGAFAADGVISTVRASEPLSPAVASPA
jgi:predicted flavoprotein YhiN